MTANGTREPAAFTLPAAQADTRIHVTQPTQFQILAPNGEALLTIHADGRWEFRDDAAPTEAARIFVREVQRLAGSAAQTPAWVSTIEGSRNASGPGLVALCQLLATDEETPPALRELSRRFVSSNLYRADRPRVRENDPETSQAAARRVRGRARAGGSVHRLLTSYARREDYQRARETADFPPVVGFTSREVEVDAGVEAAHKRTSELLTDGLLRVVLLDGEELVRDGGRVLTITDDGREELARLDAIAASRA